MKKLLFSVSVTFLFSISAGGVPVTESAGACETYKQMTGVGDDVLQCSPGPNFDVCGAYPDDEKVLMKGPELNSSVMDDNLAHREYCVRDSSKYDHCVLGNGTSGTELKPPGYVANLAPYFNDKDYQTGGNSPDWSVCLDKNSDRGGEWYSLDDPGINSYLRNNIGSLGLSTSQRSGGVHDIDYYYTRNPNPQHDTYNPRGGEKGVSLLADCGPLMDGCGNDGATDRGGLNDNQGTYFAFFENNATIEDYHPQGLHSTSYVDPYFSGYVNKIRALDGPSRYGSQLGDHFDNRNNNTNQFFDTYIGEDEAVQYAYTKYMNWSVASTGVPYPPFNSNNLPSSYASGTGVHYRRGYTGPERTHKINDTVGKEAKAFGNSLSVIAAKDIGGPNTSNIYVGGSSEPAQDLNNDGEWEDVDGDGDLDPDDEDLFGNNFNNYDGPNYTPGFDFDDDGQVDIFDSQELYNKIGNLNKNDEIGKGSGFWIDPDDLRYFYDRNFAVDGFEDGDLSEYTVSDSGSGDSASIQTNETFLGDRALKITNKPSGDTPSVNSSSGLENYPQPGDKVSAWVKWDNPGKSVTKFRFSDNGTHFIGLRWQNELGELQLRTDGSTIDSNSSVDPSVYTGVWTRAVIDWKKNGDVKATWLDREGNLLSTVRGSYNKDPVGVSFTGQGHGDVEATSYLDRVGIIGLEGPDDWREYISFKMDLTGPDKGIGFDLENGAVSGGNPGYVDEVRSTTSKNGNDTAFADIYWQQNSPIATGLEPPVCGDDEEEYLYEEQGESNNGRYACTNKSETTCVSFEGGELYLYDEGNYTNAGEPGEDEGRLKQDKEVCLKTDWNNDLQGTWYDQDLKESMCRENEMWGNYGARWIETSYINDYPLAVTGGIDDGWNERMRQNSNEHLVADPEADNWDASDNPIDEGFVPVSAGTGQLHQGYNNTYPEKSIVPDIEPQTGESYGFCAGDDQTEYPIFQDSNSNLLDTNTDIVGVASDADHCVLEPDKLQLSNVNLDHRKIYQEGELINVNDNTKIGCFQGKWWDDWPIIFIDEETSVTWGGNERASFYLINPTENPLTYDLTLQGSSDVKDITSFKKTGENQASFTLEPSSSQTQQLAINAGTKNIDETATVEVTSSSIEGEDSTNIKVTDEVQTGSGEIKEVGGITILQLSVLIFLSSLLFFYFSRPEKAQ